VAVTATLPDVLPLLRAEPLPQWWAPPAAPQIQPWAGVLVEVPPIPEPGAMLLAALGVAALLWRVRPDADLK
jgi:hypothetical protein